ncbi:uncharacterized protein [Amphiura filiformis]|uniref:uncharacterized protein n=1 Tax=Amphiura filiformis TaxID=82378 RepID=UPI003B21C8C2
MELQHIVIIVLICMVHCNANHSETGKQRCKGTCARCFANRQDSLQRMGCLEKCIADGWSQFTCPGSQSFLSAVTKPSPELQSEVEDHYSKKANLFTNGDVEALLTMYTDDLVCIVDNQKPSIGKAELANVITALLTANPDFDHVYFDPVAFGEEYGIIWVNGVVTWYDNQGQPVTKYRLLSLLKRVDGKLQEQTVILFQ